MIRSVDPGHRAAAENDNKLALTTQAALLTRVKAFFKWASGTNLLERDPALLLKAITPNDSVTQPLAPLEFDRLFAATYEFDKAARKESAKVGQYLRAIFRVQRWTGIHAGTVLI